MVGSYHAPGQAELVQARRTAATKIAMGVRAAFVAESLALIGILIGAGTFNVRRLLLTGQLWAPPR